MSTFTIILLTKHRLMRADFRGRGRPRLVGLWEQPRPAADDAGTLVDAALRLHSKRARRVWVLSGELWTNVLTIPAEVLRGVVAADMEQVLGFEAETLTGVSPMETSLAHVSLVASGSDRRYWTTQVANGIRQSMEQSVRALGGKLLGMAHPGGVPWPLDTDRPIGPWERIEFWDDVVICLRAPAQAASGTRAAGGQLST